MIVIPYGGGFAPPGSIPESSATSSKSSQAAIEPQALVRWWSRNATEVAVVGDVVSGANSPSGRAVSAF
jgi:hypothetical protein